MLDPQLQSCQPIVYGLCFWNKSTMLGLLADWEQTPRFLSDFDRALQAAIQTQGVLFAWSSRLDNTQRAQAKAANIPFIQIEDGFIRSVGLGAGLNAASSLIFDSRGIYYDPAGPSDIEYMLQHEEVTPAQKQRAANLQQKILALRVSKYNLGQQQESQSFLDIEDSSNPETGRDIVLVPGQVSDDAAILKTDSRSLDLASGENPNLLLLKAARENNPTAYIQYKPHPDVAKGLRKGRLSEQDIRLYADEIVEDKDIIDLIERCDHIETISSLAGFEALLRSKSVRVHGMPFYAGWGLTDDTTPNSRRRRKREIEDLIYLTLIRYSRYTHPQTQQPCSAEEVVDALADTRKAGKGRYSRSAKLAIAWIAERLGL